MAGLRGSYKGGLKLAALPKPEYQQMKRLVRDYRLEHDSHLFQVCIRLFLEVSQWGTAGYPEHGKDWIARIVSESRSTELPELDQPVLSDPIGKGPVGLSGTNGG